MATLFLAPQSSAHLSNQTSKAGTKWERISTLRLPPPLNPPGAACGAAVAAPAATALAGAVGLAAGCALEHAARSEPITTAAPPWTVAIRKRRLDSAKAAARGCS